MDTSDLETIKLDTMTRRWGSPTQSFGVIGEYNERFGFGYRKKTKWPKKQLSKLNNTYDTIFRRVNRVIFNSILGWVF